MTELDEILDGKSLKELRVELIYQLTQGETIGGTICSEIIWRINNVKRDSNIFKDNKICVLGNDI